MQENEMETLLLLLLLLPLFVKGAKNSQFAALAPRLERLEL